MKSLCDVLSAQVGRDISWIGSDEPVAAQYPALGSQVERALDGYDLPVTIGALDRKNYGQALIKGEQVLFGYQRFVLGTEGADLSLEKVPVFHGLLSDTVEQSHALVNILHQGFVSPIAIQLKHRLKESDGEILGNDVYPNVILGYPCTSMLLDPEKMYGEPVRTGLLQGDRYQLMIFQSNAPFLGPDVKNCGEGNEDYVGFALPKDILGFIHLAEGDIDAKVQHYKESLQGTNYFVAKDRTVLARSVEKIPDEHLYMLQAVVEKRHEGAEMNLPTTSILFSVGN